MQGARIFVGVIFAALGLSFLASTYFMVAEFRSIDLATMLAAHSNLYVFFPVLGVVALIAFPGLVTFTLDKKLEVDLDTIEIKVEGSGGGDGGGWGAPQSDSWGGGAAPAEPTSGSNAPAEGSAAPAESDSAAPAGEAAPAGGNEGFGTQQRGW